MYIGKSIRGTPLRYLVESGDGGGEVDGVGDVPAAGAVLAGHVEPVAGVAAQRVDLEGAVGGEEVLHNTRVSGSCFSISGLDSVGQIAANHSEHHLYLEN